MNKRKKTPANKTFCVWADYLNRVYQDIEAPSPQKAYETAQAHPECWQNCFEHEDSNAYRLSNDVQDVETQENFAIGEVANCKTCGSEIVETINDSNFRDGECGPCEYVRYKSQPDLLQACYLAWEEIEQWGQVMSGSEDSRTRDALDALRAATAQAHGKTAGDEACETDSEITDGASS